MFLKHEKKKEQTQKQTPKVCEKEEWYIEFFVLNFFGPVCEQTLGLIKIHQTPVGNEAITLEKKKNKNKYRNTKFARLKVRLSDGE